MAERTISVKLKADIAKYLADLKRAGKGTEDFGQLIESTGKHSTIALASIPAAAASASAATVAALGGASAAFIGLGAVALRNNTKVTQSFEDLSATLNEGLAQDAEPLADAFVGAAEQIGSAYQDLRPQFQAAFEAAAPQVATLTSGVIELAEGAMPGLVTAVESADPVFEGLRQAMADTGDATGEFFTILSERSDEAGAGMEHFGSIISGVLPNAAEMIGQLTDAWAQHGGQVAEVLTDLTGLISDLSAGALPVLSDAVGVALDVLGGVLDVIAPIADQLGPLIGLWLSLATAMKGIRLAQGIVQNVAATVAHFGDRMKESGRKSKIAIGGIIGGLALLGTAMDSVGNSVPQIDALTVGLKRWAEQGKLTGVAAEMLGKNASELGTAFSEASHPARDFSDPIAKLLGMIPGVNTYLDDSIPLVKNLDSALAGMVKDGNTELAAQLFDMFAQKAKEAGVSTEDLRSVLPKYSAAQEVASAKTEKSAKAMETAKPGADALADAVETLGNKTATTAEHADALITAWEQLFGVEVKLEEAVAAFNEDLATIGETITGVKENTDNWRGALIKANGRINLTTESGRKLLGNLGDQRESYLTLAQTSYDSAIKQGKSQKQATQAARDAVNTRKAKFIEEMTVLGLTEEQAHFLFNEYVATKDLGAIVNAIKQPGMAAARSNARNYMGELNALDGKVVSSYVNIFKKIITTEDTRPDNSGGPPLPLPPMGATGGLVANGKIQKFAPGGLVTGPGGPTDDLVPSLLSNKEFVVNARDAQDNLALLRAINSGAFRGAPRFPGGGAAPAASGGQNFYGDIHVRGYSDRFSTQQIMDDLAMQGVS